jgi:hypothetical protein
VKLAFLLQFANGVPLGVNSVLLVRLLRAFGKLRFPRLNIRLHQLLMRLGTGRYSPPGHLRRIRLPAGKGDPRHLETGEGFSLRLPAEISAMLKPDSKVELRNGSVRQKSAHEFERDVLIVDGEAVGEMGTGWRDKETRARPPALIPLGGLRRLILGHPSAREMRAFVPNQP